MKYIITRASNFGMCDYDPEVEGAVKTDVHFIDTCYSAGYLEEFKKDYTDVRQVGDDKWEGVMIQPKEAWVKEFATIEELLAFVDEYGKVIVYRAGKSLHPNKEGYREIEIYDDFRE